MPAKSGSTEMEAVLDEGDIIWMHALAHATELAMRAVHFEPERETRPILNHADSSRLIWVDVEDLFQYARQTPRPSGIQRVQYELSRALATLPESRDRIRFVRHSAESGFHTIRYQALRDLFNELVSEPRPAQHPRRTAAQDARRKRSETLRVALGALKHRLTKRMSPQLRAPLSQAYAHQRMALRMIGHTGLAVSKAAGLKLHKLASAQRGPQTRELSSLFQTAAPGDILLTLGSPWFCQGYAELVRRVQDEKGMRYAVLIYDLIPLRHPEWCDHHLVESFRSWHRAVLPLADILLTISNASGHDIARHASADALTLRTTPQVIKIGTGFSANSGTAENEPRPRDPALPRVGSYALIVSTIEARKNHLLLFRVWRRLLEEMRPEDVPVLVIAGRIGWMVGDLMQQLHNADYLGGKIIIIEHPSDLTLRQLYAGCLFTLFPSFYEGWGLPVSESLSFGRPCIVSKASSLPEAGGILARYIDPDDLHDAYRVVRHTIEDKEGLRAWQADVIRDFRPVSWDMSARSVLAGIQNAFDADIPAAHRT